MSESIKPIYDGDILTKKNQIQGKCSFHDPNIKMAVQLMILSPVDIQVSDKII